MTLEVSQPFEVPAHRCAAPLGHPPGRHGPPLALPANRSRKQKQADGSTAACMSAARALCGLGDSVACFHNPGQVQRAFSLHSPPCITNCVLERSFHMSDCAGQGGTRIKKRFGPGLADTTSILVKNCRIGE